MAIDMRCPSLQLASDQTLHMQCPSFQLAPDHTLHMRRSSLQLAPDQALHHVQAVAVRRQLVCGALFVTCQQEASGRKAADHKPCAGGSAKFRLPIFQKDFL